MDAIVKEKLLAEVTEIRDIMFKAQASFKIVDYLYRTRDGVEIEVINYSQFLKYTASIHWGIYVTEMSKLFVNRRTEHFNIHQFINKFKDGGEYRTSHIPDNSIFLWEANLSQSKETQLKENLTTQRDSLYSHTDKNRDHIKNAFTFIDAKEFLNIIKRILSEIYCEIFNQSMQMEPFNEPVDDLKRLMKILVKEKEVWIKAEETLESDEFKKASAEFKVDKDNKAKWYGD